MNEFKVNKSTSMKEKKSFLYEKNLGFNMDVEKVDEM